MTLTTIPLLSEDETAAARRLGIISDLVDYRRLLLELITAKQIIAELVYMNGGETVIYDDQLAAKTLCLDFRREGAGVVMRVTNAKPVRSTPK